MENGMPKDNARMICDNCRSYRDIGQYDGICQASGYNVNYDATACCKFKMEVERDFEQEAADGKR